MTTVTVPSLMNGLVRRAVPTEHDFALLEHCEGLENDLMAMAVGIDPGCSMRTPDGALIGLDVSLVNALPMIPTDALRARWARTKLTETPIIDSKEQISTDITAARGATSLDIEVFDPACANHEEALDFTLPDNIEQQFFYLDNPLHRRRVYMLADVVAWRLTRAVAEKGSAVALEIGPGLSPIFRAAIARLDAVTRSSVTFRAVDVSEDLLRYGAYKGWIDTGVVANLASIDASELDHLLGQPDVVVMAEVLEHVPGSASVFNRSLLPQFRKSGTYFVGSVPNTVQGAELLRLARGEDSPHQLTRPLFDETLDHVAFYTYPTLRRALTEVWDLENPFIWSNGVRMDPKGESIAYDAGLRFPHRGDRLCFFGRC